MQNFNNKLVTALSSLQKNSTSDLCKIEFSFCKNIFHSSVNIELLKQAILEDAEFSALFSCKPLIKKQQENANLFFDAYPEFSLEEENWFNRLNGVTAANVLKIMDKNTKEVIYQQN